MTIKEQVREFLKNQSSLYSVSSRFIWGTLFRYSVSKGSITKALNELAKEGLVRKSSSMKGRNSRWIIRDNDETNN